MKLRKRSNSDNHRGLIQNSRYVRVSVVIILLTTLFSSCGKAKEAPRLSSRILHMNISHDPPTLDPRRGNEVVGTTMHFILFEGLMRLNADGSLSCAQAKRVAISDDRKTYTFHLRETFWSNGAPVTALDFEKAWKKILTPNFPAANAPLLYAIKNGELAKKGGCSLSDVGIRSLDDKTLVVELERPIPYFLDLVSFAVFYPVNSEVDEQDPTWFLEAGPKFISNGPFNLTSWKHNNELTLRRNPFYWEAHQIFLDQIDIYVIPDENTALHLFENGDLDIIGLNVSRIPTEALIEYHKKGVLNIHDAPATTVVWFNNDSFPFYNKNIRKAFAYAINRKEIVENITLLGEEIATNLIPSLLKNNQKISFFKDNDTALAKEFFQKGLSELGITAAEFPVIVYNYAMADISHRLAQVLQQQWQNVLGVKIELQSNGHKVLLDKLANRNYQMAQSYWIAQYMDPMNIFERFKSKKNIKNYPHWENPEFIRLLEKSAYDSTPKERFKTFESAEAVFMEEMPLAPLYHWKTAFMVQPKISNIKYTSKGTLDYSRLCYLNSDDQ